jgi:hypothetical protein
MMVRGLGQAPSGLTLRTDGTGARRAGGAAGEGGLITEGARYDISVDGTVRTHGDAQEIAIEAANVLKARSPYSKIVIRDLQTGETMENRPRAPKHSRMV